MSSNSTRDSRLTGRCARKKLTHTDVSTSVTVAFASVGSAQHRCAFRLDCPPKVPSRAALRSVELESVSRSPVTPRTRPENRSVHQKVESPLSPRRHQAQDLCVSYTHYGTNRTYGKPDRRRWPGPRYAALLGQAHDGAGAAGFDHGRGAALVRVRLVSRPFLVIKHSAMTLPRPELSVRREP
jgi:hypothetical protein